MKTLKIEMIHDVVCSWCPIGYANLQQALRNLNIKAELHLLPFELNPHMGHEGEDINRHLGQRYGWSEQKRQDYRKNLLEVADKAGVKMDFTKRTHYYNSNLAHRLIHWCESRHQQQAMHERLIEAYFEQGLDISRLPVLLKLVEELGLPRAQADQALTSIELEQQLQLKQQRVQQLALTSVPAFIFNQNTLVSGSNSVEYFEQVITTITLQNPPKQRTQTCLT